MLNRKEPLSGTDRVILDVLAAGPKTYSEIEQEVKCGKGYVPKRIPKLAKLGYIRTETLKGENNKTIVYLIKYPENAEDPLAPVAYSVEEVFWIGSNKYNAIDALRFFASNSAFARVKGPATEAYILLARIWATSYYKHELNEELGRQAPHPEEVRAAFSRLIQRMELLLKLLKDIHNRSELWQSNNYAWRRIDDSLDTEEKYKEAFDIIRTRYSEDERMD